MTELATCVGTSAEKRLFDWEGWDSLGSADFAFYHCTTKVPLGNIPANSKVDMIEVLYESSTMNVYITTESSKAGKPDMVFDLLLSCILRQ